MTTQLVMTGAGKRFDFTTVLDFVCRQKTRTVTVERVDGQPLRANLPVGWEGSFGIANGDGAREDFAEVVTTCGDVPLHTMYQYVMQLDGSVATYQYDDASFLILAMNPEVCTFGFSSSRRRRI